MTGWLAILGDLGGPWWLGLILWLWMTRMRLQWRVYIITHWRCTVPIAFPFKSGSHGKGNGQLWPPVGTSCSLPGQQSHLGIQEPWLLPVLWPQMATWWWPMLGTSLRPMLSPVAAQGPCLAHRGPELGWLDKRVWPEGEPDLASINVGCGHRCTGAFLFSISQTQGATYFILALVTGWSWTVVPRMCTELPITHLLSTQSAPHTQAWSQDSLLLQGKSPSGFPG